MMNLPQGAELAAHRLIAGCAIEELECPLLTFDLVAYAINLRKAALPENVQDLETVVEDVTDLVVSGFPPADDRISAGSGSGSDWLLPAEGAEAGSRMVWIV